ncbi:MAG: hypothetical protein ACOCVE_06510 [Desulfovermiculus sp.]
MELKGKISWPVSSGFKFTEKLPGKWINISDLPEAKLVCRAFNLKKACPALTCSLHVPAKYYGPCLQVSAGRPPCDPGFGSSTFDMELSKKEGEILDRIYRIGRMFLGAPEDRQEKTNRLKAIIWIFHHALRVIGSQSAGIRHAG